MVTSHEDQNNPLNPDRQRRDGGQQEALGRVVQGLEGEGRLIPLSASLQQSCPPPVRSVTRSRSERGAILLANSVEC
jgi:hypothetical protein